MYESRTESRGTRRRSGESWSRTKETSDTLKLKKGTLRDRHFPSRHNHIPHPHLLSSMKAPPELSSPTAKPTSRRQYHISWDLSRVPPATSSCQDPLDRKSLERWRYSGKKEPLSCMLKGHYKSEKVPSSHLSMREKDD